MQLPKFLNFGGVKGGSSVPSIDAATLQPPALPKAPTKPQAQPGYRTRVTASKSPLRKDTTAASTLDRAAATRAATSDYATTKLLTKGSPEISAAMSLKLRTAITESYRVIGKNLDGQVDANVTALAQELLRRLTFMGAADGSFGSQQGLQSLSETLAVDMQQTGAMCLEVALDKARIPASFNVIAVNTLVFYEEDNSFRMVQKIGGDEIDLDVPTVIYTALDQNPTEAYPSSPMLPAIQATLTDFEFNNDVRRALKRAVLPRLTASIDSEKVKKQTPPEILADADKFTAYQNSIVSEIENVINGLEPEEALVSFDFIKFAYIEGGHDPSTIIERVQKVLNAKLAAGSKAMPVTLGFSSTSSGSSAESLLFLKECDGIRRKLNETLSRALTVAVRLMGVEGYVEFAYEPSNLRPEAELEAFRSMKQSRILELLSIGFISDEEACLILTGNLPPPGAPKLSGTMFLVNKPSTENPASNTANGTEKTLQPETPTTPKSKNA